MEGEVLFQQDVEGIPIPKFEEASEVELDVEVLEAAKFAVAEYNKKKGKHLEFVRALLGWKKDVKKGAVALGTFYAVILQAKDGGRTKLYIAFTFKVAAVTGTKYLLYFKCIFGGIDMIIKC